MPLSRLFHTDDWCVKGVVDAPADEVFRQMLENLSPSANKLIKFKMENNTIHSLNTNYFEVNTKARSITIRGAYWYEGVFFATAIGNSTLITYRVNNISGKSPILPRLSKRLIPIWQFNLPKKMRKQLNEFIQQIAKQLRCHAHLEHIRY